MNLELTAIIRKVPGGYVGFIEELAGANTQGSSLDEVRENLKEAALMVIEANRLLSREETTADTIAGISESPNPVPSEI